MEIFLLILLIISGILFLGSLLVPVKILFEFRFFRKDGKMNSLISFNKGKNEDVFVNVYIYIDTEDQLTDFAFKGGELRIEETVIPLPKNISNIVISVNRGSNWVYKADKGKRVFVRLRDPVEIGDIDNKDFRYKSDLDKSVNRYRCTFIHTISSDTVNSILADKKRDKAVTLFLKCEKEINGKKLPHEVKEDFVMKIKKQRYSLLTLIFITILYKIKSKGKGKQIV